MKISSNAINSPSKILSPLPSPSSTPSRGTVPVSLQTPSPNPRDGRLMSKEDMPPEDIREMTIKNLDTGEEFIIGENDPDFEFNTFPLSASGFGFAEKRPWYRSLIDWLFNKSSSRHPSGNNNSTNSTETIDHQQFSKLSSFKFRRELGRGAFGRVLLAESKVNGQLYAIKIMSKKNMRLVDKQQALAERDILHAMAHTCPHPFTTGLKFAFQSENNLYIGMKYLCGGNLKQLIQRFGSLPEEWVRFYAAEMVLAISHLHSMQVLYRDIKPHNVMIDSDGHLILIDYGLAKQDVSHPNGAISLVGTPDYSAPEILKTAVFRLENEERLRTGKRPRIPSTETGEYGYGMAADWWSVGVMIYEMLCGQPCFHGDDLKQTYQKVLYGDVAFVPAEKFSSSARELLLGFLQRDPRERLGSSPNTPQDIQATSFFQLLNWEAIYNRTYPGPWNPSQREKKRGQSGDREGKLSTEKKKVASGGQDGGLNGILEERDYHIDEEGEHLVGFDGPNFSGKFVHSSLLSLVTLVRVISSTDTTSELSESMTINESIIATGERSDPNRITRWSFMEDECLRSMKTAPAKKGESSVARGRK